MASEARNSLEFAKGDFKTVGKKARLVTGSLQIASSREAFPDITSRSPTIARGASRRLKEGLRRSQSIRMTRALACAARSATAVEVVVFPSSGIDDVNPTILLLSTPRFTSIAILIARTSSAYRENGASNRVQAGSRPRTTILGSSDGEPLGWSRRDFFFIRSSGRRAIESFPRTASTCLLVRKTRYQNSRSQPIPAPNMRPPRMAYERTLFVTGELLKPDSAGVIMRASVTGNDCCCCVSVYFWSRLSYCDRYVLAALSS